MDTQSLDAVEFRRFVASDRAQVVALHYGALEPTGASGGRGVHMDDDLDAIESVYLASGGEFLVGVLDGEVVVMGALKPLGGTGTGTGSSGSGGGGGGGGTGVEVELKRMRVRPALQGRGLGREMLRRLEAAAGDRRATRIQLDTTSLMLAARGLYGSFGYVEYARREIPGRYTLIFMEKRLQAPSDPR